jgi:hypothetical protein
MQLVPGKFAGLLLNLCFRHHPAVEPGWLRAWLPARKGLGPPSRGGSTTPNEGFS